MTELLIQKKIESDPDCTLITLKGNLDLFTYGELKAAFGPAGGSEVQERNLIVDLTQVPYVASSGWGVLMARAKALRDDQGCLVVMGLNEGNSHVYETLHVESIMPVATDLLNAKTILNQPF